MASTSLVWSPAPYHLITYSTLLGTQVFHSFYNATVAYKTLERPQFAVLQRALFPGYFGLQAAAPILLALTYPARKLFDAKLSSSGIFGVLERENRWTVLAPLATAFVTGLVNLVYLLPETNKITAKRRAQETKDGKRSWDTPPHSEEMATLNRQFGQIHGISSLLNLITLGATLVYGFGLSKRIE
ncbi:uncharacterized protein B0I36DRAFT_380007 [Microdochium trichocladiopsis]|uniref:TMEM205-like domain-containing protein n=1 Tax=Microdochium trichocladiopsis TaxID=1682393 RepID=A0A9P8YLI9_9PEZI|nr:uncharacterized protein B0I36DRAFT_380007 [Microdochium trichocladiopsis]KAH7041200.1 hypothetical protein B0I36DRAFT_380007 [Microdochium trichocladiopsis]